MYSFITKTSNGFILTIRSSYDLSEGCDLSIETFETKASAKAYAKKFNAKAWNY